ncbi:MAG: type II toxin-antitoxin system PemK/MazF family toxin [Acidimicrobiia bacterium]|jgi:mRNA interferase MazF|nr:type II toxin-antitoxin system PemK/MazF family toxin [Acidimicrobiia bacterium]
MLSSGDVVDLDLGAPEGREAGFRHPAVVVSAQRVLDAGPSIIHVVPITSTIRSFASEVDVAPDAANGLEQRSAAQCQHVRAMSPERVRGVRGNVGNIVVAQLRETIALLLDLPV